MLGGGTLRGNAILIAGPVGSGKSTTAVQFLFEGARLREPGVLVIFEETKPKYLDQAKSFGYDQHEGAGDARSLHDSATHPGRAGRPTR